MLFPSMLNSGKTADLIYDWAPSWWRLRRTEEVIHLGTEADNTSMVLASCLPACCSVFMADIELLYSQGGVVLGISVSELRTTKPSGFNRTKLVHFWLKLYRCSLIPVKDRLLLSPHVAPEADLSISVVI